MLADSDEIFTSGDKERLAMFVEDEDAESGVELAGVTDFLGVLETPLLSLLDCVFFWPESSGFKP